MTHLNFTGTGDEVRNLVGASGAFFADLALLVFGWVAYSYTVIDPVRYTFIAAR